MTKRVVFAALLFAFVASVTVAADLPPGKWWRRPDMIQALNLSEEQQNKLESIWASAAADLIDARGAVEKENVTLRTLLDAPQLDRAAIKKVASRLSEARGHLFERELTMLVDMRSVLTDQQWVRMRARLDQMGQQPNANRPNMQRRRQ